MPAEVVKVIVHTPIIKITNGRGPAGAAGTGGGYLYIGYASDGIGTGFTLVFDSDLDYIAFLHSNTPIASPQASDFAGLWKNYKGATGAQGLTGLPLGDVIWAGEYNGATVYAAGDGCIIAADGESYVSLQDGNVGHHPPNSTWWARVGGSGTASQSGSYVEGPVRITHDGGASQAILTSPALCEIKAVVVKCIQSGASRTINIGWAADTDALMSNTEVPHSSSAAPAVNRQPVDLISAATAIIATVGGSGDGEWDVYLEIARYA